METLKRIRTAFLLLLLTLLVGTLGYHYIEEIGFFDALYMTVITISTVGFHEVKTLSMPGRLLTILIISFGITLGAYTIGSIVRMFIEGEFRKTFGRRRLERSISNMKDHYIVCGYGRIGSLICRELMAHNKEVVVIENDLQTIGEMEKDNVYYVIADATLDETLMKAGIMDAKAIVTAVKSDSDNVFITLTAKGLRPDVFVLSRASDAKNEIKLKRAGAARVVSPYLIGGKRMAQVLIRPTVVDFIDIAVMESNLGLVMEEVSIRPGSSLIGKNLIDSNLRNNYGVIIVLIKKNDGEMKFNPAPVEVIEENDILVILAERESMIRLQKDIM